MFLPARELQSDGETRVTMPYAFFGVIPMEIEIRVLGTLAKRKLRAIYSYTPPWPFFDPETKTESQRRSIWASRWRL